MNVLVEPYASRFWGKVRQDGDCWIWTGNEMDGYGQWQFAKGTNAKRVHRLSYEAMVGEIPAGLVLDHLCLRKLCLNPYHLDPVPTAVNVNRWRATQTTCRSGKHEWTPENTIYLTPVRRQCRACRRETARAWRARQT